MGNAISALIMLQICKAKHWIPNTLDTILKYGDLLYRLLYLTCTETNINCTKNVGMQW